MPSRRPHRGRGFTLLELVVSLLILAAVIVAALALFDSTYRVTHTELDRVDLQQSLRIAQREMSRMVRLAGRGGLPAAVGASRLPAGLALRVDNDVRGFDVLGDGTSPPAVDGTDVLTVRGVFQAPVYLVDAADPSTFRFDAETGRGSVVVRGVTPIGGVDQDLDALEDVLGDNRPEALVLVSPFDDEVFGVAEIDHGVSAAGGGEVRLGFRVTGGVHAETYAALSSPDAFAALARSRAGSVGVLEEYRFYVRRDEVPVPRPADPFAGEVRRLSRARTYPGVDAAYGNDRSNLSLDVADHVLDFQVALAFDADGDGEIAETPDGAGDEWFGNAAGDDADAEPWKDLLAGPAPLLRFVRLTVLARSAGGDSRHMAREIDRLEDREYGENDPLNDPRGARRFPRIVLRTVVEVRNL
jgi:prepilin-type N-terminal cleavage/methylation domain-containing protein